MTGKPINEFSKENIARKIALQAQFDAMPERIAPLGNVIAKPRVQGVADNVIFIATSGGSYAIDPTWTIERGDFFKFVIPW